MEYKTLRKNHPKFLYEKYSYKVSKNNLEILFNFKIVPDIKFKPKVVIKNVNLKKIKKVDRKVLDNLVFHLGLIELLSYWKATCSPLIEIKAGSLKGEQVFWWKDLIINGMGQFFYENKINFLQPNFLKITSFQRPDPWKLNRGGDSNGVLVPVGGGKDSVVTLELLKKNKRDISCFSLNPTKPAQEIMKLAGCKSKIIVRREIDKKLLELNQKGYLNGHTPFSAYLAFLSVLVAVLFDFKFIAFSNERSSNEGNVKYLGKIINHQYSKSFDFEKKFRKYSKDYLSPDVEYFSFLRPWYEVQIAKLFSQYPKYFKKFLSCNVAFQTDSGRKKPTKKWCGKCPKCLFIFASLYPFIETEKLIKIFGKNLFEDKKLLPIMQQLIGEKGFKPFECVGTKKESLVAFYLALRSFRQERVKNPPFLLKHFQEKVLPKYPNLEKETKKLMNSWSNQHNLPQNFEKIIKNISLNIS